MKFLVNLIKFIFLNKVTIFIACFFLSIVLKLCTFISKLKNGQRELIKKHGEDGKVKESIKKDEKYFDESTKNFNNR